MIQTLAHVVLLAAVPPLMLGLIHKTKALFAGRVGPPLLQPYYDLVKLMRKGVVVSTTTTWIFRASPVVGVVTVFLAGLLVPLGRGNAPVAFAGDVFFFAYLFALARFFTTAAALDTGSPFEGMGAAREVTFACFSEPALFFGFLVLSKLSGSIELGTMLHTSFTGEGLSSAALLLVAAGFFIYVLSENCRIPVDDPNTHLELTMIHEVMVLDHSGPLFGLIEYAAALKIFVLGSVMIQILAPHAFADPWLDLGSFVGLLFLLAIVVGAVESTMARLRMKHVPGLLIAACLLCGFGFLLVVR